MELCAREDDEIDPHRYQQVNNFDYAYGFYSFALQPPFNWIKIQ